MHQKGKHWFIAAALVVMATACGTGASNVVGVVTGGGQVQARKISLPSQILGLQVKTEDVSKQLNVAKRPYIKNVGLFSLREGDLVRSTFQISHFNDLARPDSSEFRSSIIGLLGASRPQRILVGDVLVYITSGNEQHIFAWFEDEAFYVLTVHQEYEFPRTLLRRMILLGGKIG